MGALLAGMVPVRRLHDSRRLAPRAASEGWSDVREWILDLLAGNDIDRAPVVAVIAGRGPPQLS